MDTNKPVVTKRLRCVRAPHFLLCTILSSSIFVAFSPHANGSSEPALVLAPTEICIEKAIADRLTSKRKHRGSVSRLFVKQNRHEFSLGGGYYVSDVFSGTYVLNGSYTFHMTESTAIEIGGAFTHSNADIIRAIEQDRGIALVDEFATVRFVESLLLWTPVYGKFRMGGNILRFDLHLNAGVGVVDSETSRGATGVVGLGSKLFIHEALAFRIDLRNHIFRQELLDENFLVNDLSLTAGLSIFFPFSNESHHEP